MNEQDKVFDNLPTSTAPGLTLKEVSERTGMKPPQAKKYLDEMQASGKVWRLLGFPSAGGGRAPFLYVRADTSGYSRLVSNGESEVLRCVEENPDKFCFCATIVNKDGALDDLIAFTDKHPGRHEPFTHFHAAWSFSRKSYLIIAGNFWRDWEKEDVQEVERFTEMEAAYDWLLKTGVDLQKRGILPDGRPIPTEALPRDATDERMQRIEIGPPAQVASPAPAPETGQAPRSVPEQRDLINMRRRGTSTEGIAAYYGISKEEVLGLLLQRN